ncbi:uncharacterized protein [Oryza sativa Japonica Group]|nr:uncharacterized protein LOC9266291 [Oryza sativa Japonica Group]
MAAAPAFQPFTIRGFAAGMRAVDASKCWPFGRGGGDGEPPPPLPPMEPPKRSRWWAHELAAERARQEARATGTEDAGGGVAGGGGSGKGAKRKGSRGRVRAERARKWRRSLQFGLLSKRKVCQCLCFSGSVCCLLLKWWASRVYEGPKNIRNV